MNSLERSLQLGLVSSLIALMFIFWWTVTLGSRLLTDSFVFQSLSADSRSVFSTLNLPDEARVQPSLLPVRLRPEYNTPASGYYSRCTIRD